MIKWFFYSLRLSSSSSSYFPFLLILIACYFFTDLRNERIDETRRRSGGVRIGGSVTNWSSEQRNEFSQEPEMTRWFQFRWLSGFSLDDSVSSRRGKLVNVSRLGGGGGETNESLPVVDVWYGGEPEAEVTKAVAEAQRRNMFFICYIL